MRTQPFLILHPISRETGRVHGGIRKRVVSSQFAKVLSSMTASTPTTPSAIPSSIARIVISIGLIITIGIGGVDIIVRGRWSVVGSRPTLVSSSIVIITTSTLIRVRIATGIVIIIVVIVIVIIIIVVVITVIASSVIVIVVTTSISIISIIGVSIIININIVIDVLIGGIPSVTSSGSIGTSRTTRGTTTSRRSTNNRFIPSITSSSGPT